MTMSTDHSACVDRAAELAQGQYWTAQADALSEVLKWIDDPEVSPRLLRRMVDERMVWASDNAERFREPGQCTWRSASADDGYCPCVKPAGHEPPHDCAHGLDHNATGRT